MVDAEGHFKWPCMLFVTEAFAALRFRYLGRHFLTTDEFDDVPVTKVPHFVQSVGVLNV